MALRQVIVSDISGTDVPDEQHARIVVTDHPQLRGSPVELDVTSAEAERFQTSKIDLVTMEIHEPNQPKRHVALEATAFESLFSGVDMDEVIRGARSVSASSPSASRRATRSGAGSGSRRGTTDYTSPDHAGSVHRGRVTEAEAEYVRTNLDAVNARLGAAGERLIDPSDAKEKARYGL